MPVMEIVFYLFSAIMLASAICVVSVGNPIHAVMFLVLSFFSAACIWMLLQAEFLAIILMLVYVGAVMVLFLFVVMMLEVNMTAIREGFVRYLPAGILVALAMAIQMLMVIWTRGMERVPLPPAQEEGFSHTFDLGELLYTDYLYAFEIAGALLLVAIVAAIALTQRQRSSAKYQDASQQIRVQPEERMRIVKMKSEGGEA